MTKIESKKGFTILELTIAIIFISLLIIMVAVVITRLTALYQKGLSINAIGSTGKELVEDITKSIAEAPREDFTDLCNKGVNCRGEDGGSAAFSTLVYYQNYSPDNNPTNGVFCTGKYSYLWNTGYALRHSDYLASLDGYDGTFRLLKVSDSSRSLCIQRNGNRYSAAGGVSDATEMLPNVEPRLALYNFTIFDPALDTESSEHSATYRPYYTGSFLLSTELSNDEKTSVIIGNSSKVFSCQLDGVGLNNPTAGNAYCAINKFNFAARAMGG